MNNCNINFRVFVALLLFLLMHTFGYSQGKRIIGILPFQNLGGSNYNWVSRGIEELLYDKFAGLSHISIYEQETLSRVLKTLQIQSPADLNPRSTFAIGKQTGIEVLIVGTYKASDQQLEVNFRALSTYTGLPIFEKTYSGSLQDIFSIFERAVIDVMQLMQLPISEEELQVVSHKPTHSIRAFEYYCNAYAEISRGASMEVIAGYFQRALQEDPNFWEARYNLGVIYYNFNLLDKALQQFNSVIEKRPDFYKPYYGRGIIYYLQDKYHQAIDQFRTVLKLNPEHDRSYYYLGIIFTRMDSINTALEYFNKSIEINPNYAPVYYQMGLAEMKRQWFRKAINTFKKAIELNPDYYRAYNALGEAYYALNFFEEAIIAFQKCISIQPKFATAYFNLGNTVYKKGALEEIVDAFWAILEVQYIPQNSASQTAPSLPSEELKKLREKARVQDSQKIYRQMIQNYRLAIKYDSKFFEACYNLALTYENISQIDSAIYYYRKSLLINPGLAQAHMRMGRIFEQQKRYDEALEEYKAVVTIDPSYFASNPQLGEPFRYVNILELVLQEYQQRLNRNKRDTEALRVIGKIFITLGRWGQAEQYYQQLVEISPDDSAARKTLREIRYKLRKL